MTISLLCAGALARPGAQRADIEPDPRAPRSAWLPAAQLRNEVRAAGQAPLSTAFDNGPLGRALRRARVVARSRLEAAAPPELPDESWLREQFELDGTIAACTLPPSETGEAQVVVRPVHLHLGLDHLVLAPLAQLAISVDESQALAAAANHWLAQEGLIATPTRPDAWRLRPCPGEQAHRDMVALGALQAPSARTASGRNIDVWQPRGEAMRRWRQLNNLIQMAWFEHPVNVARESQGLPTINALWLEGRAGAARKRPYERIWTTDAAIAGLGRRSGADTALLALDELVDRVALDDSRDGALIAPGFWQRAMEEGDADSWIEGWHAFEQWFERAYALPAGANAIRLVFTGERDTVEVLSEAADRWKPWRALRLTALLEGSQ